jgi:hypothetical protein
MCVVRLKSVIRVRVLKLHAQHSLLHITSGPATQCGLLEALGWRMRRMHCCKKVSHTPWYACMQICRKGGERVPGVATRKEGPLFLAIAPPVALPNDSALDLAWESSLTREPALQGSPSPY